MPRGLDHIVHAVRDLDAAAEFYRRAGFTVGARNRHEWGTHNYIVQFPGVFVELIAVGEPELIRVGAPGTFSFGAFTRDFLAREQGLAMLVLEGKGAADDAGAFRSAGIGDFKVFNFERAAKRPDGAPVKVAFSLAFAADPKAQTSAISRASSTIRRISGIRRSRTIRTVRPRSPASSWSPKIRKRIATFSARFPASATSGRARMELPSRRPGARFKCSIPMPTGCMSELSRPTCRAAHGLRRYVFRSRTKRASRTCLTRAELPFPSTAATSFWPRMWLPVQP